MIKLNRLDGTEIYLNSDMIEIIEEVPDTHITLSNGNRYLVREPAQLIIEKIVLYRAGILRRGDSNSRKKYLKRSLAKSYLPSFSPE